MTHTTPSIRQLIHLNTTLKALADEASAQQALLGELRQQLPDALAKHCSAARLRDGRLVVSMDSPVWATRLRFASPQLLGSLRQRHPTLKAIEVKVAIARLNPARPRSKARRSTVGARIIHECALETSEAPLREALLRLSRVLDSS